MKIAVCALPGYSHLLEFCDAAHKLAKRHDVHYFLGFSTSQVLAQLHRRDLPCAVLLSRKEGSAPCPPSPVRRHSSFELFTRYFLLHAHLVLHPLRRALAKWKPDLLVCHTRDYGAMTVAESMQLPCVTYTSDASPVRIEATDPPLNSAVDCQGDPRFIQLAWRMHHELELRLCKIANALLRRPMGLSERRSITSMHSTLLTLVGSMPMLQNKQSRDPDYVRFVGALCDGFPPNDKDEDWSVLRHAEQPLIFLSLGTTYDGPLLPRYLDALRSFPGTVLVASPFGERSAMVGHLDIGSRTIMRGFIRDIPSALAPVHAVVTVAGAKSVLDALRGGKPMVCVPQQGEQRERAHRLEALGAALWPCRLAWNSTDFANAVTRVAVGQVHKEAALALGQRLSAYSGSEAACDLIDRLALRPAQFGGNANDPA